MLSSAGTAELIASVIVAAATILAAALTVIYGRKASRKAEEDIASALNQSPANTIEVARNRLDEELPSNITSTDYKILLARLTSDLAMDPAFAQSGNQVVEALMKNYHEQALTQAKWQYWFGIIAATVGFLWILVNGLFVSSLATVPKLIPGTIVGTVASLFLKQSRETRQRATAFYDRLHSYGRQRESLMIVRSMRDSRLQGVAQTLLALHMVGAPAGDIMTILGHELSGDTNPSMQETKHT